MQFWTIIQLLTSILCATYAVFQTRQKLATWYINMVASVLAFSLYVHNHIWGSAMMNVYYFVMSVVGVSKWKADSNKVKSDQIHIKRLDRRTLLITAAIVVFGGSMIYAALRLTSDARPLLDAFMFTMTIVATWWLTRSHLEQWILWFITDSIGVVLNFSLGLYFMTALYSFVLCLSVYGFYNWKKKGAYVEE